MPASLIDSIQLSTEVDSDVLLQSLNREDLEVYVTKSDVATVVIALGGGVGIAAVVRSVASAVERYFVGASNLAGAKKRSLTVTISGDKIEFRADNAGNAESEILRRVLR
jgi:hypothetical protein